MNVGPLLMTAQNDNNYGPKDIARMTFFVDKREQQKDYNVMLYKSNTTIVVS